jgi:hypothetical protein
MSGLVQQREVTEILIAIDAPHFYAGIVARDGKVIEAAHIVKYMKGWDGKRVANYCKAKGWNWEVVSRTTATMRP